MIPFPLHSCFLALPLEGKPREIFEDIQKKLSSFSQILLFQNPLSPHLTLYFWEEVMTIEWKQIVKHAENIASRSIPFVISVTGAETFGSHGRDHTLFLSVAFCEELAHIKKMCPWPNVKPFAPHITLARIDHPEHFCIQKKRIMKILKNISFDVPVDRLRLYADIDGKKQTPLQGFPFSRKSKNTNVMVRDGQPVSW